MHGIKIEPKCLIENSSLNIEKAFNIALKNAREFYNEEIPLEKSENINIKDEFIKNPFLYLALSDPELVILISIKHLIRNLRSDISFDVIIEDLKKFKVKKI